MKADKPSGESGQAERNSLRSGRYYIKHSFSRFAWCKHAKDTISHRGNNCFPVWECIGCYSIAQADKVSGEAVLACRVESLLKIFWIFFCKTMSFAQTQWLKGKNKNNDKRYVCRCFIYMNLVKYYVSDQFD